MIFYLYIFIIIYSLLKIKKVFLITNLLNTNLNTSTNVCTQVAAGTININYIRKSANVVIISYELTECSIAGTNGTVCMLPTGFRPSANQRISAICTYAGANAPQQFIVNTDGTVKTLIGNNTVTGVYIRNIVFII